MSSSYGQNIRFTIFGQSHSPAIGVTIEGLPAGFRVDEDALRALLRRRAPGGQPYATARREADEPEFLSGVRDGVTCGAPVTVILRNTDTRSRDYAPLRTKPRPGHADYTAQAKFGGAQDAAGGGHFSGRLTAPLCVAGGLCKQLLAQKGMEVFARIASIGPVTDEGPFLSPLPAGSFPVLHPEKGEEMLRCIEKARGEGDSVGGIIQCLVTGAPAGLGDPMFQGMENRLAAVLFGIPAVKGVEFGNGFAAAGRRGSEQNDAFLLNHGRVETETNRCGGILGGITTGMPIDFRVAIKPTPSIARTQRTVDLEKMAPAELSVGGRHDPCIVPRAVPCVEAAAAVAVYDAWLEQEKYRG